MSKLDFEIDRTVREMLDVEPPPGLRGRVLARIERPESRRRDAFALLNPVASAFLNSVASAFRRKAWILVPIAAAAVIVLAVMLPWRGDTRLATPSGATGAPQVVTTTPPPASGSTTPSSTPVPMPGASLPSPVAVGRPSRSQQVIRAAVVPNEAGADTTVADTAQVAALDGPAPLVVAQLAGPPAPSMKSIEPAPIRVAALEVNAFQSAARAAA